MATPADTVTGSAEDVVGAAVVTAAVGLVAAAVASFRLYRNLIILDAGPRGGCFKLSTIRLEQTGGGGGGGEAVR